MVHRLLGEGYLASLMHDCLLTVNFVFMCLKYYYGSLYLRYLLLHKCTTLSSSSPSFSYAATFIFLRQFFDTALWYLIEYYGIGSLYWQLFEPALSYSENKNLKWTDATITTVYR